MVYAFYYIDFSDSNKQTIENLLSSLLAQIYSQLDYIPMDVLDMYSSSKDGQVQAKDFQESLENLIRSDAVDNLFIVIDAIDECPRNHEGRARENMLALIESLRSVQGSKLHLLVTSRPESDITDAFTQSSKPESVAVEGGHVDKDIEAFISSELVHDARLRGWNHDVKSNISQVLIDKAGGM